MSTAPSPSLADVRALLTAPGAMFEMAEETVDGALIRVWKNAPPTLGSVLELSSGYGDVDFLVYQDERYTFARHYATAAQLARRLRDELGVKVGDRVSIAMRNYPEWSIAFFGATAAGAVAVPLNAWWTSPELRYGLTDSASTVLICDAERLKLITPYLAGLREEMGLRVLVVRDDGAPLPDGVSRLADLLGEVSESVRLPEVEVGPDDNATIFYTSGTTGEPKGVLGTHRNICTNLMSLIYAGMRTGLRSGTEQVLPEPGSNVHLLSVPLFHATGCHSVLLGSLATGGRIVLMYRWDAVTALELIERERVTNFGGVPAMVWQAIEHPDFAKYDISSLRAVGYGGAPAAPELVRKIDELFPGRTPSNGYGLTETSSVTTMNGGVDYQTHPDSVGVPVPVCDVKVVDPEGKTLSVGEVGELWIRGPNVVRGYWNKPAATAATFGDRWLRSGDLARIDEDGFVYIVDRAKDLLIRGGENISSAEVEAALFEHPAVTDAAVIGVPHQVLGEEVGAVVHLAPGSSVTVQELRDHVAVRLAGFKVPAHIWFFDEPLPRNPAGKILKRALKDQLLSDAGASAG
jgi:long-chain acyl-CoA synthetase